MYWNQTGMTAPVSPGSRRRPSRVPNRGSWPFNSGGCGLGVPSSTAGVVRSRSAREFRMFTG